MKAIKLAEIDNLKATAKSKVDLMRALAQLETGMIISNESLFQVNGGAKLASEGVASIWITNDLDGAQKKIEIKTKKHI